MLEVYKEVLKQWAMAGAKWVQIDEPALVLEMSGEEIKVVKDIYHNLSSPDINIMLQTYFEGVDFYPEIAKLPVQGIGLDFVRSHNNLENIKNTVFPKKKS
ncbi:MAG: 5-methyltetrahydropteroyltriglutamate--homocysteine methyltransferase [Candidatus Methanoperedenaceae archaeon GB50]|nr:MAG: 5-methyltetrahydropteroyltriglutamate--homocysteine methyltransferase [Candidatus Methanoperedenaceae archaeon GB50]